MASTLSDHLNALGWSTPVAVPADLKRLMCALESAAWPARAGQATAEVKMASALPGFATLSLDPGLTVDVELSQPAGAGFRADIAVPGTGLTLPGLTGGVPQSAGAGKSLQRWVQPAGAAVRASFCEKGKVVVHGVSVAGTAGPGSPALVPPCVGAKRRQRRVLPPFGVTSRWTTRRR